MDLLNEQGFSNVVFHQLDVQDAQSIESLTKFIQTQYGRLDILVNNAGASGVVPDEDVLRAMNMDLVDWMMLPAYSVSKVSLNAYTQILARKGTMPVEEGAEGPVMLALLPDGGPTGCYFDHTVLAEF
ncbi:(+)-neomenthol dehydrogenase-like [Solanum verrucosum]|uniref:(+)-neomenthol dehydrogenase-like n=1 Tax=Solanum verrucosum TaxID=315347 RepID=UPI0020CFFEE3|nr:(+)-neomenthol dehydrogenase-like [Solanum verrucosum]